MTRSYLKIDGVFRESMAHATTIFPEVEGLAWHADWQAGDHGRAFGACTMGEPVMLILSPRLNDEAVDRIEGIIRHEIGHAVDAKCSRGRLRQVLGVNALPESAEVLADKLAFAIWGEPILYDEEAVQSSRYGLPKRPSWLPR